MKSYTGSRRFILLISIGVVVVIQLCLLVKVAKNDDTNKLPSSIEIQRPNVLNHSSQQKQKADESGMEEGPIFYNLFVPKYNRMDSESIFREQMMQRNWTCPNATLYYNLIGDAAFQEDVVSKECPDCRLLNFSESGDEVKTLRSVWEYCQKEPGDRLVTYIHDKGSFHATSTNSKARRLATKAAMECRNHMLSTCNICTASFHIFPQYLGSANMWTARCSYIQGLYPPHKYSKKMQEMYDTTLNHSTLQYTPRYACLKPPATADPNFWGIGRYSVERWAFSHPFVEPCDILPVDERSVASNFPQGWKPQPRRAPWRGAKSHGIEVGPYKSTFARLPGRLFEWNYIYNATPPPNSWIWRFYSGYEDGAPIYMKKCQATIRNTTDTW